MVFRTNNQLGPDVEQIIAPGEAWYEGAGRNAAGTNQPASPETGNIILLSDGRQAVRVVASAAIASAVAPGTQLALTKSNGVVSAAAGSGGFYPGKAGVAIPAGSVFYAIKGTTTI